MKKDLREVTQETLEKKPMKSLLKKRTIGGEQEEKAPKLVKVKQQNGAQKDTNQATAHDELKNGNKKPKLQLDLNASDGEDSEDDIAKHIYSDDSDDEIVDDYGEMDSEDENEIDEDENEEDDDEDEDEIEQSDEEGSEVDNDEDEEEEVEEEDEEADEQENDESVEEDEETEEKEEAEDDVTSI